MSVEILFVFGLIGVVAALMASGKVRYDLVALIVLLANIIAPLRQRRKLLNDIARTARRRARRDT